jgi:hypothetical protein
LEKPLFIEYLSREGIEKSKPELWHHKENILVKGVRHKIGVFTI